jgi:hypothetical protein
MRTWLISAVFLTLASSTGVWAAVDATETGREPATAKCEFGRFDDHGKFQPCAFDADDDAYLGARLLVIHYGNDAPTVAYQQVQRYLAEHDTSSAAFWRRIAAEAVELIKRR